MLRLYTWTAWREGEFTKIAGISEEGFRTTSLTVAQLDIEAQTVIDGVGDVWLLLPENANPEAPGCTAELCDLLSNRHGVSQEVWDIFATVSDPAKWSLK